MLLSYAYFCKKLQKSHVTSIFTNIVPCFQKFCLFVKYLTKSQRFVIFAQSFAIFEYLGSNFRENAKPISRKCANESFHFNPSSIPPPSPSNCDKILVCSVLHCYVLMFCDTENAPTLPHPHSRLRKSLSLYCMVVCVYQLTEAGTGGRGVGRA